MTLLYVSRRVHRPSAFTVKKTVIPCQTCQADCMLLDNTSGPSSSDEEYRFFHSFRNIAGSPATRDWVFASAPVHAVVFSRSFRLGVFYLRFEIGPLSMNLVLQNEIFEKRKRAPLYVLPLTPFKIPSHFRWGWDPNPRD